MYVRATFINVFDRKAEDAAKFKLYYTEVSTWAAFTLELATNFWIYMLTLVLIALVAVLSLCWYDPDRTRNYFTQSDSESQRDHGSIELR